jgi:hypothetical protein
MAPRLLTHLRANNFEALPDKFGRKPATFYRNFCRQEGGVHQPMVVVALRDHGFNL